jgi:hypothetical protein
MSKNILRHTITEAAKDVFGHDVVLPSFLALARNG